MAERQRERKSRDEKRQQAKDDETAPALPTMAVETQRFDD
ncbi:UNVERIFIED_ORG: hypothetical protein QE448_000202 [Rhizobium sp. SORGH_AS285]|nr:hypothetical protein [Rhizobium sp. SORGH_AS_0285]